MVDEKQISRYEIKGLLGKGAMGSVFLAYDPNLQRHVAVKTMRVGSAESSDEASEFEQRFFQESRVYARLSHPNIVAVYDCGIELQKPFLVMEYIEGHSLDQFVSQQGEARFGHIWELLRQIASGLDYAHEEGVVHRDIKPGNILISTKLKAKIVDFGLAKLKDSNLTQTGLFLGTPSYSSPEQIVTGRVDWRSDIYSFGTVAYEMITGHLPFDAGSLHSILYQIANEPPKLMFDAFTERLDVHALSEVFLHVFDKEADARFQTAHEFVEELKPLLAPLKKGDDSQKVKPKARPKPKPKPPPEKATRPTSLILEGVDAAGQGSTAKHKRPPKVPKVDPEIEARNKVLDEARRQFYVAYKTKNASSIRYCLDELRRLGDQAENEIKAMQELERELEEQKQVNWQRQRDKHIAKARAEFRLAYQAKNLPSSRYCFQELTKLGANIEEEREMLASLEQQAKQDDVRKKAADQALINREKKVKQLKASFRTGLKNRRIEDCETVVASLLELDIDPKAELKALARLQAQIAREEEQREDWIKRTRAQFRTALDQAAVDECRRFLFEMQNLLKVDTDWEQRALAELEQKIRGEKTAHALKEMLRQARSAFSDALERADLRQCGLLISRIKELNGPIEQEERQVAELRRQLQNIAKPDLDSSEQEKVRRKRIDQFRFEFIRAFQEEQVEACRYYLNELTMLRAEVASEKEALQLLEQKAR